jgi:hypothetical protein
MSSSSPRPRPTALQGPDPQTAVRRSSADGRDHDRVEHDGWTEHVQRMEPDDLRQLALSLPLIEQAKGILMGHYGCEAAVAFAILRRWSSNQQLKLRDLAADLVAEASRVDGRGAGQRSRAVERYLREHGLG